MGAGCGIGDIQLQPLALEHGDRVVASERCPVDGPPIRIGLTAEAKPGEHIGGAAGQPGRVVRGQFGSLEYRLGELG